MKRIILSLTVLWLSSVSFGQEVFDSTSKYTPSKISEQVRPLEIVEHTPDILRKSYFYKSALQVKYGKLNEEDFKQLKSSFNNSSLVKFDLEREYELIDFLPPVGQALLNQVMFVTERELRLEKTQELSDYYRGDYRGVIRTQTLSNCEGTAYEFLRSMWGRSDGSFAVYLPDRYAIEVALKEGAQRVKQEDLRVGDLLVVRAWSEFLGAADIQHVAVVVGENLVFEKTGGYYDEPYRIFRITDVIQGLKNQLDTNADEGSPVQVQEPEYYRFAPETLAKRLDWEGVGNLEAAGLGSIQKPLQSLGVNIELFYPGFTVNMGGKPVPFAQIVEKIPLVLDKSNGRYVLDSNHPQVQYFSKF